MRTKHLAIVGGVVGMSFFGCASEGDADGPGPTGTTPAGATANPTGVAPTGPSMGATGASGPTGGGPTGGTGAGPTGGTGAVSPGPTGGSGPGPMPTATTSGPATMTAPTSNATTTTTHTGGTDAMPTSSSEPMESTMPDETSTSDSTGAMGSLPMGNPAVPSSGCGKAPTLTSGKHTITSTGQQRSYIIDIPNGYDMNKPHRLFYTSHWIGSTSEAVRDQNYYFLKPLAQAANEQVIFVAPQSDGQTWQEKDHALFDDILALVKGDLCIDTTRVFATGFSFGGMITYSLSVNHQKDIRAAVGIAPANYNIWLPQKTGEPIAWMQTTGMSDGTCPWVNNEQQKRGAKFIGLEHATNNGCDIPEDIPVWTQGGHVCYDFEGCDPSYPTKVCTFGGGHTNIDNEQGGNWIATESWDFFMQF